MVKHQRFVILVLSALSVAAALWFLWPTDESRIRKLIKEGADAVEARDVDGIMAKVSFSYRDNHGMTYLSLKEILKREIQRHTDISVEYDDLRIQVSGGMATAEADIRVIATTGNETGYIIGDVKTPVRLRFALEKEGTKWHIVRIEEYGTTYRARSVAR